MKNPTVPPTYLQPQFLTVGAFIRTDNQRLVEFYSQAVTSMGVVEPYIVSVESMPNDLLDGFVDVIPNDFATADHFSTMKEILKSRRDRLRSIFQNHFGGGPHAV